MAEGSVDVQTYFCIQRVHLACWLQNKRVDFCQVAVTLGKAFVQLHQHVGHAIYCLCRNLCIDRGLTSSGRRQTLDWVDVQFDDRGWIFCCNLFNLDSTLRRQHQEVLFGRTIKRERCVILLGNVGCVFNPDALHNMALDIHAQNVSRMQANFVCVVGQLDTASLAAAANLHLRLYNHRILRCLCLAHCFVNSDRNTAR